MTRRLDYNQVAPNVVKALGGVYDYVMQSGLSAELVDLVYLRVSQINNCAYCLDTHTRDLIKKGVKIEKLALVQAWAETGHLFNEHERAAVGMFPGVFAGSGGARLSLASGATFALLQPDNTGANTSESLIGLYSRRIL